ncbi:hypothetical protein CHUAL_013150 [Chamberlinius hualienensis]
MKGWFDAFRTDGGPTLYSYSNRTPASDDVNSIFVYLGFTTLFVAFIIIFPGIRKERFTTFLSVTLSLFIGLVILLSIYGSDWHVANTTTTASYKAFSREKIVANIGVHIGLNSVNVTLKAPINVNQTTSQMQYNERFYWEGASELKHGYKEALKKGLPFPILTIVEYLSLDGEGFCWGGRYRIAGYFSAILLWASLAIWLLMNLLFCVVPRYGAFVMTLTGLLLLLTNIVYYANLPPTPLVIPFETGTLRFTFGWCYWLVLATGFICITVGSVIAIVDVIFPHKFSTILEVDFDTPYDRHIILQDKGSGNGVGVGSMRKSSIKCRRNSFEQISGHSVATTAIEDKLPSFSTLQMKEFSSTSADPTRVLETQEQLFSRVEGASSANGNSSGGGNEGGGKDNFGFEGDHSKLYPKISWKRQFNSQAGGDHSKMLTKHNSDGHMVLHRTPVTRRNSDDVNIQMQSAAVW